MNATTIIKGLEASDKILTNVAGGIANREKRATIATAIISIREVCHNYKNKIDMANLMNVEVCEPTTKVRMVSLKAPAPKKAPKRRKWKSSKSMLLKLRTDKGITQAELGKTIGVTQMKISAIETRRRKATAKEIIVLSDHLAVSDEVLFDKKGYALKNKQKTVRTAVRKNKQPQLKMAI